MRKNIISVMTVSLVLLAGCVTVEPNEQKVNPNAAKDEARIAKALERRAAVNVENDPLTLTANLQLPEIEIARTDELEKQLGIDQRVREGATAVNGHICIQMTAVSKSKKVYLRAKWQPVLVVDGKQTAATITFFEAPFFNMQTGKTAVIPGRTNLRVCTDQKSPDAKSIQLSLKSANKVFATFDWKAPWPPLHQ